MKTEIQRNINNFSQVQNGIWAISLKGKTNGRTERKPVTGLGKNNARTRDIEGR